MLTSKTDSQKGGLTLKLREAAAHLDAILIRCTFADARRSYWLMFYWSGPPGQLIRDRGQKSLPRSGQPAPSQLISSQSESSVTSGRAEPPALQLLTLNYKYGLQQHQTFTHNNLLLQCVTMKKVTRWFSVTKFSLKPSKSHVRLNCKRVTSLLF